MNDMEQRLRDAFSAKAGNVTAQSLHGGMPDLEPTEPALSPRRSRSRIVRASAPFLAAAAVVGIVVGAFVAGRSTQAERRPAGSETPTPPATVTVTVSPSPTPTVSTTAAPATERTVLIEGVSASIPSSWQGFAGPRDDSPFGTQCWGAAGSCELAVFRADNQLMFGKPLTNMNCTSIPVRSYDMTRIDGRDAEHIVYGAACGNPAAEEWLIPTRPQVYLLHALGTDDAAVEDAVRGATLPGAYGPLPGIDYGFIDSVSKDSADMYTVTVSRAILNGAAWQRWSPAVTYSFPMSVSTGGFFCYSWRIPGPKTADCTVADLYLQGQKGSAPADGSLALGSLPIVIQGNGAKIEYIDYVEAARCACAK